MDTNARVLNRLEELLREGSTLLATRRPPGRGVIDADSVDSSLFHKWCTSCLSILSFAFGEEDVHFLSFKKAANRCCYHYEADAAYGVLQAANEDWAAGFISSVRQLVHADLLTNFTEQAETLLDAGYYQAAAVLLGGVLEDALRTLCDRHAVAVSDKATIDPMNIALAKGGVYDKLVQKQVNYLADLRNKAAHGKWTEFQQDDVVRMLRDVVDFTVKHLS